MTEEAKTEVKAQRPESGFVAPENRPNKEVKVEKKEEAKVEATPEKKPEERGSPDHPITKERLDREAAKRREAEDKALKAEKENEILKAAIREYGKPAQKAEEKPAQDFSKYMDEDLAKELFDSKKSIDERMEILQQSLEKVATAVLNIGAKGDFEAYKSSNSDFDNAKNYIFNMKKAEGEALGMDEDQQEVYANAHIGNITSVAMKTRKNAPSVLYDIAQKMGYKPETKEETSNFDKLAENISKTKSIGDVSTDIAVSPNGKIDVSKMIGKNGFIDRSQLRDAIKNKASNLN